MLGDLALLEGCEVERLRFTALLTLYESLSNRLDLEAAFLLAPDQVAVSLRYHWHIGRLRSAR